MFELFSERARRAVFFSLYEANSLACPQIMTEHLLLGILREDKTIENRLGIGVAKKIRKQLEELAPPDREQIPKPQELPLSPETRRALHLASEEAEALQHKKIDTPHMILALLRVPECTAAGFLREYGMEHQHYQSIVRETPLTTEAVRQRALERPAAWHQRTPVVPLAKSLQRPIEAMQRLVDKVAACPGIMESYGEQRLKRKAWTRKEALGHLIDWAMLHQQWLTCVLTESKLTAAGYPDEAAVAICRYAETSWPDMVDLWVSLNRLLIHVLLRVPEDKLEVPCRIGIAEPMPLGKLIDTYVLYCEDIVAQILARLYS